MSPLEKTSAQSLEAAFRMAALSLVKYFYKTEKQPYPLDK